MTHIVFVIDPFVTGLAILVVLVTEIACRVSEAGALIDGAIKDTGEHFFDDWAVINAEKLDQIERDNGKDVH